MKEILTDQIQAVIVFLFQFQLLFEMCSLLLLLALIPCHGYFLSHLKAHNYHARSRFVQWRQSYLPFEIQSHGSIKGIPSWRLSSPLHHSSIRLSFRINRSQTRIDTLITSSFQYLKLFSRLKAIQRFFN